MMVVFALNSIIIVSIILVPRLTRFENSAESCA